MTHAPIAVHGLGFDDAGRLTEELPCSRCGYNLRGLTLLQGCPECGEAVEQSVRGDLLRFASPAWLASLVSGATWLLWAVVVSIVVMGVMVSGALVLIARGVSENHPVIVGGNFVGGLMVNVVMLVGVWRFTRPEPGRAGGEPPMNVRTFTRYGLIASMGLGMLGTMSRVAPLLWRMSWVLDTAGGLLTVAVSVTFLVLMRRLAERVPSRGLAQQILVVTWGFGVAVSFTVVTVYIGELIAGINGPNAPTPLQLLVLGGMCMSAVAVIGFGVWGLVLFVRLRSVLVKAAEQAAGAHARWLGAVGGAG